MHFNQGEQVHLVLLSAHSLQNVARKPQLFGGLVLGGLLIAIAVLLASKSSLMQSQIQVMAFSLMASSLGFLCAIEGGFLGEYYLELETVRWCN